MPVEQRPKKVSHRTHWVRPIQNAFQSLSPAFVNFTYRMGWVDGTPTADVLTRGEDLHADHLTLTAEQLTVNAFDYTLTYGGYNAVGKAILGFAYDGIDGMYARLRGESGPTGAVHDVVADRAADDYMAKSIAIRRNLYGDRFPDSTKQLTASSSLSAMAKAGSEMFGVLTHEGGEGSMLERRIVMFRKMAQPLGYLNRTFGLSEEKVSKITSGVDASIDSLIATSHKVARKRIEAIKKSGVFTSYTLENPQSPATIEAGKYAVIARMNEIIGLDMVDYLNVMAGDKIFPRWQDLAEKYSYIGQMISDTAPFVQKALEIAYLVDTP